MDLARIHQIVVDKMARQEPTPKSKKVKGTGLSVYGGGVEKTPTGRSNAFTESGLTEETLLDYASRYNFPTTSNKDFQKAQIAYLESTPEGKKVIQNMMNKYGMPKAGTLADGILGARTFEIMNAVENITPKEEPKPKEKPKQEVPPKQEDKKTEYSFTWRDDNKEGGQDTYYFKDKASYDEALKKQMFKNRGFVSSTKTGQGSKERGASALFINNPFVNTNK
jgi:hypothetical protein